MNLMLCLRGEPEQLPYLPDIAALGAGIELGSYGLLGVQSPQQWDARVDMHAAVRASFSGPIALHGPFIGIEYGHVDHLLREAVNRRLDLTFAAATQLGATRVVLHGGYNPITDLFHLQDAWLHTNIGFWQHEIRRWADARIQVVLENDTDRSPDLLVSLVDAVDDPSLGLCLDIGHVHVFSDLDAVAWLRRMAHRLRHIHLHDNDGARDRHWPLGRGTIPLEPFYAAVAALVPDVTIALEVEDDMAVKLDNLRTLAATFAT